MRSGLERLVTPGTYLMLFLFGAAQGLLGSFQYSRNSPFGAIGFVLLIGGTCLLGSWAMRSPTAAFLPALGWLAMSVLLSAPMGESVIIANTPAGKWYLYGGTVVVVAASAITFGFWRVRGIGSRQPR